MPEVTGRVEKIQDKQAKNSDVYTTISLNGQKKVFFDWEGRCEAAGITAGDTVRIEHDGSRYPRVTDLQKVGVSEPAGTNENEHQGSKGERKIRMCALECAAQVLRGSELPYEQQVGELTSLAEHLEKWLEGEASSDALSLAFQI